MWHSRDPPPVPWAEQRREKEPLTPLSLTLLVFQANTTALLSEVLLRKTRRHALLRSGIFPTQIWWCDKVAACRKEGETPESNREGRWHAGKGSHTFILRLYSKAQEKNNEKKYIYMSR